MSTRTYEGTGKTYHQPRIALYQKARTLLEEIYELLGVDGSILDKHDGTYMLSYQSSNAIKVLQLIYPYLKYKKEVADGLLTYDDGKNNTWDEYAQHVYMGIKRLNGEWKYNRV